MKGYKVFNPDWKCRDFQYKVGETFRHEGKIKVCIDGFHFCQKLSDCFSYYKFNSDNKVAEIEATGKIETYGDKSVTDEISIVRELGWHEVLDLVNEGKNCTGFKNSGDYNSGNCNSGYRNSGDFNSGYRNSGDHNSGKYNSGDYNSGDYNSGNYNSSNCNSGNCNSGYHNSGDCNSGNYNSGYFNSCDYSTGFFNSVSPPVYAFNKPLSISRDDFLKCDGVQVLNQHFRLCTWIPESDMTDDEKEKYPEYKSASGYLKTSDFKTAFRNMWDRLDAVQKQKVCEIPDFDPVVFEEITGIDATNGGELKCLS